MKLTKETLKRIIKEEMSALINELGEPSFGHPGDDHYRSPTGHGPEDLPMNKPKNNSLKSLQKALESDGRFDIEQDNKNPQALSIETSTDGWTASVNNDGELILDFNNSNSEQIVGLEPAIEYFLEEY